MKKHKKHTRSAAKRRLRSATPEQPKPTTKICRRCGKELPLAKFPKNRTRPDGTEYRCKECHAQTQAEYRKRRFKGRSPANVIGVSSTEYPRAMMSDETFAVYYDRPAISAFITQYSVRHAKRRPDMQLDLKQTAWMHISMAQPGKTDDYYIAIAQRAMYNEYRREYFERKYKLSFEEGMTTDEHDMWRRGVIR